MKNVRLWYGVCAAIFVAGAVGCAMMLLAPRGGQVEISQRGEVLYRLDLRIDRTLTVECDGGFNVIEIKDGSIRVTDANCPDKTCVRAGELQRGGLPIVCLPHKLVIKFSAGDADADAVAG